MADLHFASQAEADRYAIKQSIESHKRKFRTTRRSAAALAELERRRHALSAPVYRLPDDILSEVFKFGALSDSGFWGDRGPCVDFSLTVSHVVSRWRRVALSTPCLWTSFRVCLLPVQWDRHERNTSQRLLERCGALHLQLDLFWYVVAGERENSDYAATLLNRCQALEIQAVCSKLRPPCPLPLAPYLVSLDICGSYSTADHLFDFIVGSSRSLRRLTIRAVRLFQKLSTAAPSIDLPVLESLRIYENEPFISGEDVVCNALEYFVVPQLRSLHIDGLHGLKNIPKPLFASIRAFSLRGGSGSKLELFETLCCMPAMEKLAIGFRDDIEEEHGYIDGPGDADGSGGQPVGVLLPPITHLRLYGGMSNHCNCMNRLARMLVGALRSTRHGAGCLKAVDIHGCALNLETREWIREQVPDWSEAEKSELIWLLRERPDSEDSGDNDLSDSDSDSDANNSMCDYDTESVN